MIVLLFGQPASGKTTLANAFINEMELKGSKEKFVKIDGDRWREVSNNKDYSKEGRMANLKSAFTMAKYLDNEGFTPVLSFVTPYQELRNYLSEGNEVLMIYLTYLHLVENRGRNGNFANDFEIPNNYLHIDTSLTKVLDCVNLIISEYNSKIKE